MCHLSCLRCCARERARFRIFCLFVYVCLLRFIVFVESIVALWSILRSKLCVSDGIEMAAQNKRREFNSFDFFKHRNNLHLIRVIIIRTIRNAHFNTVRITFHCIYMDWLVCSGSSGNSIFARITNLGDRKWISIQRFVVSTRTLTTDNSGWSSLATSQTHTHAYTNIHMRIWRCAPFHWK